MTEHGRKKSERAELHYKDKEHPFNRYPPSGAVKLQKGIHSSFQEFWITRIWFVSIDNDKFTFEESTIGKTQLFSLEMDEPLSNYPSGNYGRRWKFVNDKFNVK